MSKDILSMEAEESSSLFEVSRLGSLTKKNIIELIDALTSFPANRTYTNRVYMFGGAVSILFDRRRIYLTVDSALGDFTGVFVYPFSIVFKGRDMFQLIDSTNAKIQFHCSSDIMDAGQVKELIDERFKENSQNSDAFTSVDCHYKIRCDDVSRMGFYCDGLENKIIMLNFIDDREVNVLDEEDEIE